MARNEITLGIGYAVIDAYTQHGQPLPQTHEEATAYVLANPTKRTPGGGLTNIISTLAGYTGEATKLVAAVGNDALGDLYQDDINRRGLGNLQRSKDPNHLTGIYIAELDNGNIVDQTSPMYGAAADVVFDSEQLEDNNVGTIIFNGSILNTENPSFENAVKTTRQNGGMVVFNTSVVDAQRTTKEQVHGAFQRMDTMPDIVIGNKAEFNYLTDEEHAETALDVMYESLPPGRRLAVVTLGGRGSRIKFGEDPSDFVDVTVRHKIPGNKLLPIGMGDTFNGILLGELRLRNSFEETDQLTKENVEEAATIASDVSAMVGRQLASRLNPNQLATVRRDHHGK